MQPAHDAKLAPPNKGLDNRQPLNPEKQQILEQVALTQRTAGKGGGKHFQFQYKGARGQRIGRKIGFLGTKQKNSHQSIIKSVIQ